MPSYTLNFNGTDGAQSGGPYMNDGDFGSTNIAASDFKFGADLGGGLVAYDRWTYRAATDSIDPDQQTAIGYVLTKGDSNPFALNGITLVSDGTANHIRITQPGGGSLTFTLTTGVARHLTEADLQGLFDHAQKINVTIEGGGDIGGLGIVSVEVGTFAPELSDIVSPVSYHLGDDPIPVFSPVDITDGDNSRIQSATVWIRGSDYHPGEDVLSVDLGGLSSFSQDFDAATGTLTIIGDGTATFWESLLATVAYRDIADHPTLGDRVILFTVNDGESESDAQSMTVLVEEPDTTPPGLAAIAPPDDATYHFDNELQFTVYFDEAVIVAGGAPRLELKVGGETVYAEYQPGLSGSTDLAFVYKVPAGDFDDDGVEIVGVDLHGATIRDAAGNNAILTFEGADNPGVLIDGAGPTVTQAIAPEASTYRVGAELEFQIKLSAPVMLNGSDGDASLAITIGGHARQAIYSGGVSPGDTLTFTYTVQAGDADADGIAVGAVDLNHNVFYDADGNPPDLSNLDFGDLSEVTVDAEPPTVLSITPDHAATNSEVIFRVTFSEDVDDVGPSDFRLTSTNGATGVISGIATIDDHTYDVTVSDVAGAGTLRLDLKASNTDIVDDNENAIVGGYTGGTPVTVDLVKPEAPSIALDSDSDTGAAHDDLLTKDATPTIRGTVEPFSTVEIRLGGEAELVGTVTATAGGSWAYTFDTPLPNGSNLITAWAKDAAGNASDHSDFLSVDVDATAPTVTVSAGSTHLLAGQSTTLTFTFSEAPIGFTETDLLATGGALSDFTATANPKVYTATYTPGGTGTEGVIELDGAFEDKAGNAGVAPSHFELAINQLPPSPPPPPPPPPVQTATVDGVQVGTSTTTNGDGSTSQVITVPVVTSGRVEAVGQNTVADIPLVTQVLTAQVPTGFGLQVSGPPSTGTVGSSLTDLIREIRAHTDSGSSDQTTLTGGGSGFLGALDPTAPLLVRTVVPSVAGGVAPNGALVIEGSDDADAPRTALVIDTRGLPTGVEVQLQNVSFAAVVGSVTLRGGEGSQTVYGDAAGQNILLGADDDDLHGGAGNDTVGSATGADSVQGDAGDDIVFGGEGNDFVHGNAGVDTVNGNAGADVAYGGKGDDRVQGDAGDDKVFGDLGDDFVHGNMGADTVDGGAGNDTVHGGQDADLALGGDGNDFIDGDHGADTVNGGKGDDNIFGDEGGDQLRGGQGDDVIRGEAGDDWLAGDLGNDTLIGGDGADTFHSFGQAGLDLVLDFHAAEGDRVRLLEGTTYSVSQVGADTVIDMAGGAKMVLAGVTLASLADGWIGVG